MIGFIKGVVDSMDDDKVLLDCMGMGYNIFVPGSTISCLREGDEVKLYTYLSVREDAMNLFGFLSKSELDMFKKLITVSGIGPKGGLSVLSIMTADELRMAIISGDDKMISKAPGIGPKTAMKVIVELKDKVDMLNFISEDLSISAPANPLNEDIVGEAVMALIALGYSQSESVRAIKSVSADVTDVETLIKESLRKL